MTIKQLISTAIMLILSQTLLSQPDWQWGISGGSFTAITNDEEVESITTDPQGNVFFIASVGHSNLTLDGIPQDFQGNNNTINQMIGSFDCEGNYRWARTIGGGAGLNKFNITNIKSDNEGNVYIGGRISRSDNSNPNIVFGGIGQGAVADTILPQSEFQSNTHKRGLFLVKYNSEGAMQWLKFPQAEDIPFSDNSGSTVHALEVNPETGHSYVLARLMSGVYGDGAFEVTAQQALHYVLEYDSDGNFVSGTLMDFLFFTNDYVFRRNHQTGRFYLSGYVSSLGNPFVINGESFTGTFVAGFEPNGNFLWMENSTETFADINDIFIDEEDDTLYITGGMGNNVTFFGITFVNPSSNNMASMLFKASGEGELIWHTYATGGLGRTPKGIAISGGEVALFSNSASLVWQDFEIDPPMSNGGDDVYILRFNKYTGILQDLNVIESNFGNSEIATSIAADPFGNYYAGGRFSQFMYVGEDTLLNGAGSFDFFIAKYGSENCNCVLPTSNFSIEGAGTDYNFTFTGSTEASTVTWNFGDDTTGEGFNPSHSYESSGAYQVCATVTDACGSTTYCTTLEAVLSLSNPAFASVKLYPNPATSQLNINTPTAMQYQIYNVVGASMQNGTTQSGTNTFTIENYATGVYYLTLTAQNGAQATIRWVKTE